MYTYIDLVYHMICNQQVIGSERLFFLNKNTLELLKKEVLVYQTET